LKSNKDEDKVDKESKDESNIQMSGEEKKDENKGKEIIVSPSAKGKEKENIFDEIDLDTKIVIPKWDQSNLTTDHMEILSDLWRKREH
jgi:co-chaperonin GroES (HSP10)